MRNTKWLSLFIWGTPVITQKILMEELAPTVLSIGSKYYGWKWFFVRFWDGLPQFRFRILTDECGDDRSRQHLSDLMLPYLHAGQIWKMEWQEYHPEIGRYGQANIRTIEDLFYLQSKWAFCLFGQQLGEKERLKILMDMVHYLFEKAFPKPMDQHLFVREQHRFFGRRLKRSGPAKKSISRAYRDIIIDGSSNLGRVQEGANILKEMSMVLGQLEYTNEKTNFDLVRDVVHMMVNKCFLTDHGQWEFLLYEFLDRTYRSRLARNGKWA
ncbi:thiopeptide-type bacteriocin biosynthesis protein [Flagellimonas pacifica]|uniref:Thiopeptide-type bacteriocin biosynthesis domain-containing protein n=1 Tax=Flagellimonas pacifica TaxID=1247520 RepID=A0A285MUN5_9FLAO|nr:thiopeptide-type bacteriocin biosynthesis protein [Allomuricauda parva]SNY99526.1 thiopeptide-type bacteriocin biosynthesis domain-containing protein [Allomuricauda parva]